MAHPSPLPPEGHPHPTLLSDFILGCQDGLVNVLGILLGLAAAGAGGKLILIGAVAALSAETISMGAVGYTSTLSRRNLYNSEVQRELREMRELPDAEREEVRQILRKWGYEGEEVETMLRMIEAKPKAWLDIMMAFELNLSEVDAHQPRNTALVVLGATVTGSVIPILPFIAHLGTITQETLVSIVLSGASLFTIGWYEARITLGRIWINGPRMLLIGLSAGFAGFLAGWLLHAY